MNDTSSLKEMAKYGSALSATAAIANPLAGGVGLVICGTTYIAADLIDRLNRRDNQKNA